MKLFLDSSTNYLYLALNDGKEISSFVRSGNNDHSETLVDVLKKFLDANKITVDNITDIYVGRGPGSYTGVRISGTIAKVLALVKNKKLYSFSTLDLMLVSKINSDGLYLSRITAKKNHSYYKAAKIKNNKIELLTKDLFSIDTELINYDENIKIEANEELFNTKNLTTYLLDNNLCQEEDIYNYVPNYLRSEING